MHLCLRPPLSAGLFDHVISQIDVMSLLLIPRDLTNILLLPSTIYQARQRPRHDRQTLNTRCWIRYIDCQLENRRSIAPFPSYINPRDHLSPPSSDQPNIPSSLSHILSNSYKDRQMVQQ